MEGLIYDDDKQIKKLIVEKFIDKENPHIDIALKELK